MASKTGGGSTHAKVFKHTSQGGGKPKTSSMNKTQKRNHKKYRGQGR
jgi:hypothetical protein